METPKEKLFLIPKGSNGLRLHPRAFVDENMKSYEKVTGILLSVEQIEKLEADKAELLEALVRHTDALDLSNIDFYNKYGFNVAEVFPKTRSLIQKMKQ